MPKVLYVRVSDEMYADVSAYADRHALTLTGATKSLLNLALRADSKGWHLESNLKESVR